MVRAVASRACLCPWKYRNLWCAEYRHESANVNHYIYCVLTLTNPGGVICQTGCEKHWRNRKCQTLALTWPCMRANVCISLICTLNPDLTAIAESMSTLCFAQHIKKVQLNVKKVVDTNSIAWYKYGSVRMFDCERSQIGATPWFRGYGKRRQRMCRRERGQDRRWMQARAHRRQRDETQHYFEAITACLNTWN